MYTIMYGLLFTWKTCVCVTYNDGNVSKKRSHFIWGNLSLLCVQINELQKRKEVTGCKLKRRSVGLDSRPTSLCPCLPDIPRTLHEETNLIVTNRKLSTINAASQLILWIVVAGLLALVVADTTYCVYKSLLERSFAAYFYSVCKTI
jgi:hypothetical protein